MAAARLQLRDPVNAVLAASVLGLVISLGAGGYQLLTLGHAAFNTRSDGMNWGLPIVTYDYFVLTSTGLALIACLPFVLGWNDFYPVARRCLWLALAALIAGGAALMLELGHPVRALYAIPLNFQYQSPMFWKVLFIGAYVALLLMLFLQPNDDARSQRRGRAIAIALLVALLGVTVTAGALFGMMAMRPFWFGGMVPVLFLVESILGGLAFAIVITYVAHGFDPTRLPDRVHQWLIGAMPRAFALLLGVMIVMIGTRALTGAWSNADGLQVWGWLLSSPLFYLELGLGLMLPLLLMLTELRSHPAIQLSSAVLVLLALFISRYEFIIGGQMVPLFKGSWVPGFIDYAPSFAEWMLALLSLSITFAVYAVGEKWFDFAGAGAAHG